MKIIFRKLSANFLQVLTLSNLGDSIPLSNLGGGWNLPELNNSRFLYQTCMKFCMIVGPHKTNLNVYFWHDGMINDFTLMSQKFDLLC